MRLEFVYSSRASTVFSAARPGSGRRGGKIWAFVRVDSSELPIKDRPIQAGNDQADHFILFASSDVGRSFERIRDFGDYGEMYMSLVRLTDERFLLTFILDDYTVQARAIRIGIFATRPVPLSTGSGTAFEQAGFRASFYLVKSRPEVERASGVLVEDPESNAVAAQRPRECVELSEHVTSEPPPLVGGHDLEIVEHQDWRLRQQADVADGRVRSPEYVVAALVVVRGVDFATPGAPVANHVAFHVAARQLVRELEVRRGGRFECKQGMGVERHPISFAKGLGRASGRGTNCSPIAGRPAGDYRGSSRSRACWDSTVCSLG